MWNWLKRKLGIFDLEKIVTCQHQSIEAIELAVGIKRVDHFRKQVSEKHSQRYDEIERDRKRRKKGG